MRDSQSPEAVQRCSDSPAAGAQMMLYKHRLAVIDATMALEGEPHGGSASAASAARHATQSALSASKAYYDDLLGPDNALTAEAQVALALLGIADGLAEDPGAGACVFFFGLGGRGGGGVCSRSRA